MKSGNANATAPTNAVKCAGDQSVQDSKRKLNAIQTVMAQTNASAPKANARLSERGSIKKKLVRSTVFIVLLYRHLNKLLTEILLL
jgi:hypothetical protein